MKILIAEQLVIEELNNQYAQEFRSAKPSDTPDPALNPLIDYLGEAYLVGLGEGTHGTKEFYEMKDQIFRNLVVDKGFKAIVFELPWGNAWIINEYVTKGIGTLDDVIDQGGYWTYDTQEVRDLAQWMHDYNQTVSDEEKIYFIGNDPQGSGFSEERNLIIDFLNKVQPDSVIRLFTNYNQLPRTDLSTYKNADPSVHEANIIGTQKVYDHFIQYKDAFIAASSELEYEIALMATHLIQHREYIYRIGDYGIPRDSLMAVYSEWWQQILADNAKVALWAHNYHVMNLQAFNTMGTFLKDRHQENYRTVGFSFSKGNFMAVENSNGSFFGPFSQNISDASCQTINQVLEQATPDQYYLLFEEMDGESSRYFSDFHPYYMIGAVFNSDELSTSYTHQRRLSQLFDVLIHFDETRAALLR